MEQPLLRVLVSTEGYEIDFVTVVTMSTLQKYGVFLDV